MNGYGEKMRVFIKHNLILAIIVLLCILAVGCDKEADQPKTIRIAVAGFAHETCTFCPNPTTIDNFEKGGVFVGDEVIEKYRGVTTYINGFIKVAEEEINVELVGILDASNSYGGSSGSWLTRECFDKYSKAIAEGIEQMGPFDGVLLALHGAMASEEFLMPEAEIVRRVRAAAGDVPIMVTLDLHANENHELTEVADGVFIIKTYPHVDTEEIGMIAARCLIDTIRGNFVPTMAIRKPGVITPSVYQGTGVSPAKEIIERAREWEKREEDVYSVSVAFGFAYADVPDVGATVIAVTNSNQDLAEEVAEDVSNYIWSLREPFAGKVIPKTKEGVQRAISAAERGETPVILADHSDRMGDATHVLRELLAQEAEDFVVATIADRSAIHKIESQAQLGDTVEIEVGGHAHDLSGTPVKIQGKVEFLGECEYAYTSPMGKGWKARFDKVAVLGFGENNHLILTKTLHQVIDDAIFPAVGLNLADLDIVAIKSRVHFRAFFDDVAGSIIEVDSPGLGPADLTGLSYTNIPKDIYPVYRKD
ncbi:M81 family metallopeptidase [Acidobacteriota bacterium]